MKFLRRLYSFDADVDFRRGWRVAFVLSGIVLMLGIGAMATSGLKLGIDFKGGTSWQFPAGKTTANQVRDVLKPIGAGDATIQTLSLNGKNSLRVEAGTSVDKTKAAAAMAKVTGQSVDVINANRSDVGPSWGRDVSQKALRALIVFFIAIAIYISWQLEWRMAVGAIVAVIHDLIISVGVYAIFQFEVTPGTVVAFLTILGYSLYDTIVVYDKVKANESMITLNGDTSYSDMMNLSLNQTFMRSINTTLSAVIPVLSILLIGAGIMGAVTLREFGLALLVGLFFGAYSSVFIASPIVVALKNLEPRNRKINARLAAERSKIVATPLVVGADDRDENDNGSIVTASSGQSSVSSQTPSSPYSPKHPPRPRKQGKKR